MEKDNSMNQQENDKVEVMLQMIKVEYGAMREEINNTHSHIFMTIEISSATITSSQPSGKFFYVPFFPDRCNSLDLCEFYPYYFI